MQKVLTSNQGRGLRLVAGSGVVGTAPLRCVEEVEEEDSDVHFKRKLEGRSCRKSLVKKPRRQAPTVVIEGEPSAAFPPAVPLVVEPSVTESTTGEFAPDLGKISSVVIPRSRNTYLVAYSDFPIVFFQFVSCICFAL